jgi:hypothetical protein
MENRENRKKWEKLKNNKRLIFSKKKLIILQELTDVPL